MIHGLESYFLEDMNEIEVIAAILKDEAIYCVYPTCDKRICCYYCPSSEYRASQIRCKEGIGEWNCYATADDKSIMGSKRFDDWQGNCHNLCFTPKP
jgi:hypothetical protein